MYNNNVNISQFLGEDLEHFSTKPRRSVFLNGANFQNEGTFKKVAPAPNAGLPPELQQKQDSETITYDVLKPIIMISRILGIFPIANVSKGVFRVTAALMAYSLVVFLVMVGYIGYIKYDKVDFMQSAEGRFEEAVIEYLFSVYLLPIIVMPLSWLECRRLANVLMEWSKFERIYENVEGKKLPLFFGNKPFIVAIALPLLSVANMVINHITMVNFKFVQVVPYCFINMITFVYGGIWYLQCEVIGKVATLLADDFQKALKNIGPSSRVAEFRNLWMLLAKITRDVGGGSGYVMIFLNLYLFLIITMTIYGLVSTLQYGFGIKDVGLCGTAAFFTALLYFSCDEAHYASNCVRVHFQKKLLLVELSWMNEDAHHEINMFLRATEMNPTDMSLIGFFDMNRNLFKSLLATMVTYLVVLLQFQISIPEDMPVLNATTPAPK